MSKLNGVVGKDIESVFSKRVVSGVPAKANTKAISYKSDVCKFIKLYDKHKLLDHIPGRYHKSFPNFVHEIDTEKITDLKRRLRQYSLRIDNELTLIPE